MKKGIAVVLLVLALSFGSYLVADQAGVLGKIAAAQKAAGEKDGAAVTAALQEAGQMMVKDAEGSGAAGEALAGWNKEVAGGLAALASKGNMPPDVAVEVLQSCVADLYGAMIPASKGDTAAAAAYIKKKAAGASGPAKDKLNAAAAGSAVLMRGTLGALVPLLEAADALEKDEKGKAARLFRSAAGYLKAEASIARAAGEVGRADILRETGGMLAVYGQDIIRGISPEVSIADSIVPDVEKDILMPSSPVKAPSAAGTKSDEPPEEKKERMKPTEPEE